MLEPIPHRDQGFHRVVVAISDRPEDLHAVDAAVRLATSDTRLTLVHVVELPASYVPEAGFPPRSMIEQQYAVSRQLIEAARHHVPSSIHVDEVIREGYAADQIVHVADEWAADLIVVGTRGGGRLVHFLRGSTAEEVMQRAGCPVMVVNYHAHIGPAEVADDVIASPT